MTHLLEMRVKDQAGWSQIPAEIVAQAKSREAWLASEPWEFLAFGAPEMLPGPDVLRAQVREMQDHPEKLICAFMAYGSAGDILLSQACFSPPLGTLLDRAGSVRPAVISRRAWDAVGPFRDVAEPTWDWLIRAVLAGVEIQSAELPPRSDQAKALGSAERVFAALAPERPASDRDWLRDCIRDFGSLSRALDLEEGVATRALQAGLFQWHDFLEESHEISQDLEGQGSLLLGDYWHAIMHRREPDYSNAKYWFRRIGNPPMFRSVAHEADVLIGESNIVDGSDWRARLLPCGKWNPLAFVDFCQAAATTRSDLLDCAQRIQHVELVRLIEQCHLQATCTTFKDAPADDET